MLVNQLETAQAFEDKDTVVWDTEAAEDSIFPSVCLLRPPASLPVISLAMGETVTATAASPY